MTYRETALVRLACFWAKWITFGLLTRDQSEVDSDLTNPRPFQALMLVSLVRQRLSLRAGYFEN
jgi:hypothetical protein